MALKDRFDILDIETNRDNFKEQVVKEVVVEADLAPVFDELANSLSEKVASIPVWFDYTEDQQRKLISGFLTYKLENQYSDISFSNEEKEHIISLFMNSILGFGELDEFISREDIKALFVNADGSILVDNGTSVVKEKLVITPFQFERIFSGLKGRINCSEKSLVQISLNKLIITLFSPPVSEKKIIFEKLKTNKVDFEYLLNDGSIDKNIYNFIKSLIEQKKNILIAGSVSSGKTALSSAVAFEIYKKFRYAVFENYPVINCEDCDKYYIKGLNENGLVDLLNVIQKLKYDYTINDTESLPVVLSDAFENGYFASLNADTVTQAVTKLAGYKIYNEKCSEKQAKAYIASKFDYIFLLKKNEKSLFKISSIAELSLNKAGSLVLTEILNYFEGSYRYNFSEK